MTDPEDMQRAAEELLPGKDKAHLAKNIDKIEKDLLALMRVEKMFKTIAEGKRTEELPGDWTRSEAQTILRMLDEVSKAVLVAFMAGGGSAQDLIDGLEEDSDDDFGRGVQ